MGIGGISRCHEISVGIDEVQIPDMASAAARATCDTLRGAAHIQCAMGLFHLAEQCIDPTPEAPLAGMDDGGCTPTPGPPPQEKRRIWRRRRYDNEGAIGCQPSFHDPQYEEHHRDDAYTTPPPQLPRSTAFDTPAISMLPETMSPSPTSTVPPSPTRTLQPPPRCDHDMAPVDRKRRNLKRTANGSFKAKQYGKRRAAATTL